MSAPFSTDGWGKRRDLVAALAGTARRQHGIVSLAQLLDASFSRRQVENAVRDGLLVPVHRGVFALAYVPRTMQTRLIAAVLAVGDGAATSHISATILHRLLILSLPATIDIVTLRRVRSRQGIRVHARRKVEPVVVDGIRVTDVATTTRDLASTRIATPLLRRAVRQAQVEHKVPYEAFVAVLDGSPGTRRLRAVLGAKAVPTRSMAEDRMEALLDRHGFPPREHNAEVAGEETDVLFADARLIVEVDSRGFHTSQIAQENDRRKQAAWEAAGYAVLRITRDQLVHDTERTFVRLRHALAARR
jgi:hypothetical protein